jgi:hypothetical protein
MQHINLIAKTLGNSHLRLAGGGDADRPRRGIFYLFIVLTRKLMKFSLHFRKLLLIWFDERN